MSYSTRVARHALMFCLLFPACESTRNESPPARDAGTAPRDGSTPTATRDAASADASRPPGADASSEPPVAGDGAVAADSAAPVEYVREACELVETAQGDGPAGTLRLDVEVVVQGLEIPWGLAWLPNGDLLVTERPGRLRMIRGGQLQATPLLDVEVAQVSFLEELGLGSEGGLLGVLLHPEFETNRLFFMYFTARGANNALINRLGVYELAADGSKASFKRLLLDDIPSGIHHQGGRMQIGPDGKLYVGVGAYTPTLAQQPDELPGKLLRLNLDGSVPDDNPTPGSPVFLTGVRNTQGFDWYDDRYMLVMDHGPTSVDPGVPEKGWDEFNVVRGGENLGWPDVLGCNTQAGISEPVLVFERSLPPGGAAVYRGTAIGAWKDSFLVATLGLTDSGEGEHLHRFQLSADNPYVIEKHETYLKGTYGRLRTVAMGPDGHLYVTTSNCDSRGMPSGRCADGGDKILRIVGAN
ncbi:MAG TPA: PQQ-dependent sugar dehydrogenase [Polyangiales bacterium]|nr:PQQ-dependent sugar dehydrogenase [Polyangiales bacterium]